MLALQGASARCCCQIWLGSVVLPLRVSGNSRTCPPGLPVLGKDMPITQW